MRSSGLLATSWCRPDLFSALSAAAFREVKQYLPLVSMGRPVDIVRRTITNRFNNFLGKPPMLHLFDVVHHKAAGEEKLSVLGVLWTLFQNKDEILQLAWNFNDELVFKRMESIFQDKLCVYFADHVHRVLLSVCPLCKRER